MFLGSFLLRVLVSLCPCILVSLYPCILVSYQEKNRNPGSSLYSEARLAFRKHVEDPDAAVARECKYVV